ncbi:hypothetical protein HIM_09849 [Hirsutella minnesotensis 3608]|uniref:HTH CENPB-type domain-containing protein n=1 Tax=Hirsutella minnesotensis 3608 TaxID=1043627 RepID=A0A0F7ZKU4_9HYPO|nr:hypothetical protein HIM_09849 [Hirsutella minnesotensis 3608]
MSSPAPKASAVEKWIDSETGKLIFSRQTPDNLELRTIAAVELFRDNFYPSLAAAATALSVPYGRARSRLQGNHTVEDNGGNRTMLLPEEEDEILCWAYRRVTQGHHLQRRSLQQHANAILKANSREERASRTWAQRFVKRHKHLLHRRKATSRDVKRKAMQDRARIEAFFKGWSEFIRDEGITRDNVWNFDETGFMVGYLQKGTFLWTFSEIERPVLTDAHDTVSVTAIEAVSAAGKTIPSFLIIPGVQLKVRWFDNNLDGDTVITTSPKGYTNDVIALEWAYHFERHTRPVTPGEKRILLMDGCDNHFTEEMVHFCQSHAIELFPMPPHLTHHLQPLDVGVFRSYKHWHQQVLYREVADGCTDFGKTDFLFHLQEIRQRTFKKKTILTAWEKCGLFPFNPRVVLDRLQDALSSLSQEVDKSELPGFIDEVEALNDAGGDITAVLPTTPVRGQRSLSQPPSRAPSGSYYDWNNAVTPRPSIIVIRHYQEYVRLRIASSITSGVPLTPSLARVFDKACKAGNTLAINGITSTAEMQRLKEKQLRRSALESRTQIIGKYGPLTVHDARIRASRDEFNRRAAQEDEERRVKKKQARDEAAFLRRWLRDVRGFVRNSISCTKLAKQRRQGGWLKADRRAHLASTEWLCARYHSFRLLVHQGKVRNSFTWPDWYDVETVQAAINIVISEQQERTYARQILSLEADGLEITDISFNDNNPEEFIVIKEEENDSFIPAV